MKIDLESWKADEPSPDFADRVVAAALKERAVPRRRKIAAAALLVAGFAIAILASRRRAPLAHGEIVATTRTEMAIGTRAIAVVEPGGKLTFHGDEVDQTAGSVFYRVNPGGPFVVHTPAGDVSVLGTCFDVKVRKGEDETMKRSGVSAVAGAAIGALAVVGVYEGKVRVSHATEQVVITPGEHAKIDASGAKKLESESEREAAERAIAAGDDAFAEANKNLVENVQALNRRLGAIEDEKTRLQKKLAQAEAALERSNADGGVVVAKNDFDLSSDEWAELAKNGTVKYELPCFGDKGPPASSFVEKGFSPDDAAVVEEATKASNDRVLPIVRELCAQAVGSAQIAERIPASTCIHLVLDIAGSKDRDAANEAMRQVGEIRAGIRPAPGPNDPVNPVLRLFLATTAERPNVEREIAARLGPDEAKRILDEGMMCMSRSTFSGAGPRKTK